MQMPPGEEVSVTTGSARARPLHNALGLQWERCRRPRLSRTVVFAGLMSYRRSKHLVAMQMKNLIKTTPPPPPPPLNTRRTPVQTHDQRRGAAFRELAVGSQPRLIFKYNFFFLLFFFPRPAHVLNEVKVSVTLTVHELVLQPPCGAYVVKQHRDLGKLFK